MSERESTPEDGSGLVIWGENLNRAYSPLYNTSPTYPTVAPFFHMLYEGQVVKGFQSDTLPPYSPLFYTLFVSDFLDSICF